MPCRRVLASSCLALVLFACGLPSAAHAAVTAYTSLASFQAAYPTASLATDLETHATGGIATFNEGGLNFSSPLSMYIIGPAVPGTTTPLPPSKMLSASGPENFLMTVIGGWTYAFGMTILTNAYGPHTVTLYDTNGTAFYTYHPTQAHNTIGFIGFVSDTRIAKVRWVSDRGEIQNTALDNFWFSPEDATPTLEGSWGRLKALYR